MDGQPHGCTVGFKEWLSEQRAVKKGRIGRRHVLFWDNCSSHNENDEVRKCIEAINAKLRMLPANSNDFVLRAESSVISKIKYVLIRRWDEYKVGLITKGEWIRGGKSFAH